MDAMPRDIRRVDDRELHIAWADGHQTVYGYRDLRQTCPCAGCVDEHTGRRTLRPESVPADIRAEEITLVGRYAIQILWSDRHSTGIFTFQRLRADCPCEVCRARPTPAPPAEPGRS